FGVRAVGVIWDETHRRVVTLPGKRGRVLPRVTCTGMQPPWIELGELVRQTCRMNPSFQWVGVWQDAAHNLLEFVFAAVAREQPLVGRAAWSNIQHTPLGDREFNYLEHTGPDFLIDPVWMIQYDDTLDPGDVV
ncbi:MAG: hypothetical protein K8L99_00475, partial [Anaerolineae bacterium]|nr:hypothetical protein [Anaerolineae bacterium]